MACEFFAATIKHCLADTKVVVHLIKRDSTYVLKLPPFKFLVDVCLWNEYLVTWYDCENIKYKDPTK